MNFDIEIKRKWIFYIKILDDEDGGFYINHEGNKIDYTDAIPFIGNNEDARNEAGRRADLWEEKNKGCMARITYESLGKF